MKNMLIAQSGGPTAAINASLSGAVKRAMKHPEIGEIYGARNGLEGLLEERFVDFRALLREEADFERLKRTPAMLLGSCRLRLSPEPDETYEKILGIFRQYRIGYFFYIGGNDSRPVNFRKRYYRILAAAGIEKKGLHSLRHTFASNLVNGIKQADGTIKSLTPRQVADLLGHSTSQITELYYVKKDTSRLHGITDGFNL